MSQDPRHLKAANRKLSAAREERRAARTAFELRCRTQLPELERLDRAIQGTLAKAIAAALQQGTDPTAAVAEARRENLALQQKRLELLRSVGIDPAQLEDTPLCPACGDTGWHDGQPCQCVREICVQENLAELAEQLDLERCEFTTFDLKWYSPAYDGALGDSPWTLMSSVLTVCQDYAQRFPDYPSRNLYLYGGTGLGKTLLSGCIAKRVAQDGHWTVYATTGELLRHYEDLKFGRDEDGSCREAARRYEGCELLVMDDLGSEQMVPFVKPALYQLLNQRLLQGKHTVISSNLDMDEVRRRYEGPVASRLEGEFQELPFFGRDIRLQRKEEGQS